MSTDEQMTMALLALGAVALFAMNNKTESKTPVRRAEDVENSKRVEIQKWIKNARALISKIDSRTHTSRSPGSMTHPPCNFWCEKIH